VAAFLALRQIARRPAALRETRGLIVALFRDAPDRRAQNDGPDSKLQEAQTG